MVLVLWSPLVSLASILESCLELLSWGCTFTSCSTCRCKCWGIQVCYSVGRGSVQEIALKPGIDADTFIVDVSWCTCAVHRDCRNWFVLMSVLVSSSVKSYNSGFLEFWYPWTGNSAAILDFCATNLLFWIQIYGQWTNHHHKCMNGTNFTWFTNTKSITNLIMDKKTNADTHFASWCLMPFY